MSLPDPVTFAEQWIEAWNRRDVEAVLRWYDERVRFSSPTALRVVPETGGIVVGKDRLRAYWERALTGNPDLQFTLRGAYAGVDTIALHYRNQAGGSVVETLTFEGGLVVSGSASHPVGPAE
jgi:hypothetical protein